MWQQLANGQWMWFGATTSTATTSYITYTVTVGTSASTNPTYFPYIPQYQAQFNIDRRRQDTIDRRRQDTEGNIYRDEEDFYTQNERQHREAMDKHKKEAAQKAEELLLEHLNESQRKTYRENKWFIVEGGKSGHKYRINVNGTLVANIDVLENNRNESPHRICCHARLDACPLGDQLLAQKLMLELDEDAFLRMANRHRAA